MDFVIFIHFLYRATYDRNSNVFFIYRRNNSIIRREIEKWDPLPTNSSWHNPPSPPLPYHSVQKPRDHDFQKLTKFKKFRVISENSIKFSYCYACGVKRDNDSYHCSDCDVCIDGYDHHCPWTGKCIGKGNKLPFLAFIIHTCFFFNFLIFVMVIWIN